MQSQLIEKLATELERPRELTPRVVNYITGTYGVDYDGIGAFVVEALAKLEEDEIDLILSPLFTPKLTDQAVFAGLLGRESVPPEQTGELVHLLVARPTRARLVTLDSQVHAFDLQEVTVERYVRRLRLEGSISEPVFKLLEQVASADDTMLRAVARRAVWENEGPRQILVRYLTNAPSRGGYDLADAVDLLSLVEGRKPADPADLLSRMQGWQKALREQVDMGSGGKPFFLEDIRFLHGGDRDQRPESDVRLSAKEKELAFLLRLQQILD